MGSDNTVVAVDCVRMQVPFRVGAVSYTYGVSVVLKEWLVEVGGAVKAGEAVAVISVEAEDMNKPGVVVNDDFEVVAPADGRMGVQEAEARGSTLLGERVATMLV